MSANTTTTPNSIFATLKKALKGKGNTTVRQEGESVIVTLHSTDILTHTGVEIILNNGGWATNVTKDRINLCLGALGNPNSLNQRKHQWYLNNTTEFHRSATLPA